MSVAEKLTVIAENTPKVFSAGYEKGKAESVDYMPYVDTLIFADDFSKITDDVVLHLERVKSLHMAFAGKHIYCNKITIFISDKCTDLSTMFHMGYWNYSGELKEIEIIGDTSSITRYSQTFTNRIGIERIIGEFDFSNATTVSGMLSQCRSLKHFTPKKGTIKLSISFSSSPDLTDESIQSIIEGYADMTGQTSPILTVHPDVKAKIEANSEWLNTLINKNVTLA